MIKDSPVKLAIVIIALLVIAAAGIVAFYPHEVEITYDGEGKVEPSGKTSLNVFSSLDIEIDPNIGWKVAEITVDGKSIDYDNSGKFTFKPEIFGFSTYNIHVKFVQTTDRLLTVETEGKGTVNLETDYYSDGSVQKLIAEPSEGYVINDILIDGISVGSNNVLDITMDKDHIVKVIFVKASEQDILVTVSVDIQVDTNIIGAPFGTVSPSGNVKVKYGGNLTVYISLNDGFHLSDVIIDGSSKGPVTSYTITDITESVSISIKILDKTSIGTYTIVSSASSGGKITPEGTITVDAGSDLTFRISANSGYGISSVIVDGKKVSSSSSYTFKNINENHTISVKFVRIYIPDNPNPPAPLPILESIEITKEPVKTIYVENETLDITGLEVVLHYNNAEDLTVTSFDNRFTFTPEVGSVLEKEHNNVTVSFGGKSDSYPISVKEKGVGMDVYVTEVNGTVLETKKKLSDYVFSFENITPGTITTAELEVTDVTGLNLEAFLVLFGFVGDEQLADYLNVSVSYNSDNGIVTDYATLGKLWNSNDFDSNPLRLGTIGNGMNITLSMYFDQSAGNELMDKSLSFTLGIWGDRSSGGSQ